LQDPLHTGLPGPLLQKSFEVHKLMRVWCGQQHRQCTQDRLYTQAPLACRAESSAGVPPLSRAQQSSSCSPLLYRSTCSPMNAVLTRRRGLGATAKLRFAQGLVVARALVMVSILLRSTAVRDQVGAVGTWTEDKAQATVLMTRAMN
jgi:hypothetical protein